ncbi:hypothetical protein [Thiohalorhabdus methylotrophus]|uniref:Uncharacterized protein n=1 Tax=Thiohalorhabdus methylotrophus TaxID=3242694 RepID=A0ABV4TYS6_9GAMM
MAGKESGFTDREVQTANTTMIMTILNALEEKGVLAEAEVNRLLEVAAESTRQHGNDINQGAGDFIENAVLASRRS